MQLLETLPWADPINMARGIPNSEEKWIFLFSGLQYPYTGRFSILALHSDDEIQSDNFSEIADKLTSEREKFDNAWFGYFGYGLKNCVEELTKDVKSIIDMPDLWLFRCNLIIIFDHEMREINVWGKNREQLINLPHPSFSPQNDSAKIAKLSSNMTKSEYLNKVSEIKSAIKNGDLYQANLTRKFYGELENEINHIDLFAKLCTISPSAYSAYVKFGDTHILSSSPERFIQMDRKGFAETRPIKGSAPRFHNVTEDKTSKGKLANSEKDKSENLMIVDLMRNDFSRSCEIGSVNTLRLFDITSYSTIHHMSSTVEGQKRPDISTIEFIKNAFPPGSMTGAPKIRAMETCSNLEQIGRGIYSGAIGWFGGDGSCDLSVTIRTVICQGKKFEFQVGGAIVNDSNEEMELEETIFKAKAISQILNIEKEDLEAL